MNTGFVDLKLLKASLERLFHVELTPQDMENIIKATDSDGDGKLSLDDFAEMITFLFVPLLPLC
jgi:Ca2+-binding EF-hand superfamily protein